MCLYKTFIIKVKGKSTFPSSTHNINYVWLNYHVLHNDLYSEDGCMKKLQLIEAKEVFI